MSASPETDLAELNVAVPRQQAAGEPGLLHHPVQHVDGERVIDVDAAGTSTRLRAPASPTPGSLAPVWPGSPHVASVPMTAATLTAATMSPATSSSATTPSAPLLSAPGLPAPLLPMLPVASPATSPAQPGSANDPRELLRRYRRWAVGLDAAAALISLTVTVNLRFPGEAGAYLLTPLIAPFAWVAAVAAYRTYEHRFLGSGPDELRRVLHAGLLLFTAIAVISFSAREDFSRGVVMLGIAATVATSLLARLALRIQLHRARAGGHGMHRVLVVGRADAAVGLIEQLVRLPSHGYVPVGVCVPGSDVRPSHIREVPVIGHGDDVLSAVDAVGAHVVAVASHPDLSGQALRRLSWALDERGVELIVSPGIVDVAGPRLSIRPVSELSLLHLERPAVKGGWLLLKSAFDRVTAALLLLVVAPLMLGIAAAVRITSNGPALFRQVRVGASGRTFTMYKFRSMVVDADRRKAELAGIDEGNGVQFKVRSDPRVTAIGRFLRRKSLDELPQLINVLRGEMSLVGPRPPLPDEVAVYCDDATRRLRVRPGMTGLWQVSGRSDLSWQESLRLDLRYVDNWSLSLDLVILWRTVRVIRRGTGAY